MAYLLLPGALSFDFWYDLDLCSQGQAVRAFFIGIGFSLIFSKVQVGILVKHVRKLHSLVAHDILIITLWFTYFCMYCVQLKPSIDYYFTKLQNYELNFVLLARNLEALMISHCSLKSTKEILFKNLHRKVATWLYYYCPLVDLLICILCEFYYVIRWLNSKILIVFALC